MSSGSKKSTNRANGKKATSRSTKAGKPLHVVPQPDGWAVKRQGSSRALRLFNTQAEAIKAATKTARNSRSEVVIHGRSGVIRQKVSTSPADSLMLRVWDYTSKASTTPKKR